ncbi:MULTISPECIES: hypothetical protein [Paraburkholderia]|uniref:Uncharacterized protein n=1 Tax=Paraburkholderia podalyriae TaxID=1938811 RepID=A0ABR7PV36_9BURK|nr:hypothetical protein [Paraburkholderia podalyriae]MBC8750147.1 hypothetical protein [Paraburkholderia podalyriae]
MTFLGVSGDLWQREAKPGDKQFFGTFLENLIAWKRDFSAEPVAAAAGRVVADGRPTVTQ